MSDIDVVAIADQLDRARRSGQPCPPLSDDLPELDVETAYAIQRRVVQSRIEGPGLHGRPATRVGRKIGLTSAAIQDWLGVTEPDFGILLDDMVVPDAGIADASMLLQPRAEAEIAFVLGQSLSGPGVTAADVIRATDSILPAIEIIDSRIADWNITYEDTIADNASSGMFALGNSPQKLDDVDLRLSGMKLTQNGRVVSTGAGAACLGHPINAVVWLANKLGEFAQGLAAGEVVLSGALGPAVDVQDGDWLRADIAGLGSVSVGIES